MVTNGNKIEIHVGDRHFDRQHVMTSEELNLSTTYFSNAKVAKTSGPTGISYSHVGEGPRILLIIGFSMRADIWRPQIEALAKHHHVAWYDNRGIAESDCGDEKWPTMTDFAKDGIRVLDALGWDNRVHIVGVSMGGMIAQELVLQAPQRCTSLTLIATHSGGSVLTALPPIPGIFRFLGSFWMPKALRVQSIRGILYPPDYLKTMDQEALARRIRLQLGRPAPKRIMLRQVRAVMMFDTTSQLASLDLPTLIIRPGKDILVSPRHSDRLAELLPNSSMLQIPEAGHGVIFQCADVLNRAIEQHIASAIHD
jgi:3-oxoadipate enol-lactonase